jgi:hypothetical protein
MYSESAAANCTTPELAHDQCLNWASTNGARFAPQNYTLTHFSHKNNLDLGASVQVNGRVVAPSPTVQILGVQLDTRLRWKAHIETVNRKNGDPNVCLKQDSSVNLGFYSGKIEAGLPSSNPTSDFV